jgi:hypothetical protein
VAHPKTRVTAFVVVRRWATPVLDQEEGQVAPGEQQRVIALGVERPEQRIGGDRVVEPPDQRLEEGETARGVVQADLGRTTVRAQRVRCQDLPSVWTDGA